MRWQAIYRLSKRMDMHSINDSEDPKASTALATMHRKKESTAYCGEDENSTRSTYFLGVHYETQNINSVRTVAQLPYKSDLTVIDR